MVKRCYVPKKFSPEHTTMLLTANEIIDEYLRLGLRLTLRQLYYQFVAHDRFPDTRTWTRDANGRWKRDPNGTKNADPNYEWLGGLISDGRLAGVVDWNAIEDRGRIADEPVEWPDASKFIEDALRQFRLHRWEGQTNYVELWVEKQALAGVLEPIAERSHVTLMVNKGYSSSSAMYASAQRIMQPREGVQRNVILYVGDLDPSGEDMVRDIRDRLALFGVQGLHVEKVALTPEQVAEHNPPPNPAKTSDSRYEAFAAVHGDESFEVDALDPETLVQVIEEHIGNYLVPELMQEFIDREERVKKRLKKLVKKMEGKAT